MTDYTFADYRRHYLSGDYFEAAKVAGELAVDTSYSEALRKSWADTFWTMYWECDEYDRAELLDMGYRPASDLE